MHPPTFAVVFAKSNPFFVQRLHYFVLPVAHVFKTVCYDIPLLKS